MMRKNIKLVMLIVALVSSAFLLQSCEELAGDISEVKVKMPLERITFDVDSAVMAQKSEEIVFAQY
ncbi:MAG: hypothetical protein U9R32_10855, partial [Bacteroidota bacterium]|nr:hypothetical protein [Bacteroidota bacterium]